MRTYPATADDLLHEMAHSAARPNPLVGGPTKTASLCIARCVLGLVALALINGPVPAPADDVPAVSTGFEHRLFPRYTQAFGSLGTGIPSLQEFGGAGYGPEPSARWRIDPHWLIGAYGEFARFQGGDAPNSDGATSAAAGLFAQYHMLPEQRFDPWVSFGFGWRGYWASVGNGTYRMQGMDLVRLRVGLDHPLSSHFTVGPFVGATVTRFRYHEPVGSRRYATVDDKTKVTFVAAGISVVPSL